MTFRSDAELVDALLRERCAGPCWLLVRAKLAGYAVPCLHRMILDGTLVTKMAALGRPVTPTDAEWRALREHADDRVDLVHEAVCLGLELFRDRGVLREKWDPQRETSLRTYFVNGCLLVLPNVLRAWRRSRSHTVPTVALDLESIRMHVEADPRSALPDIVDQLIHTEELEAELDRMSEKLAAAVRMRLETEWSWTEIAPRIGISPRALEGLLHRHRKDYHRRAEDRS